MRKMGKFRQKFSTGCLASPCERVTLGAGSEKETSDAGLSLRHLSLRLKTKGKAPTEAGALKSAEWPCSLLAEGRRNSWDVTIKAHPALMMLAYYITPRKTVLAESRRIGDENIVTVGSRHTFPEKQRAACSFRYRTLAPDGTPSRDNPGNEQASPVTRPLRPGHCIRASGLNLWRRKFQEHFFYRSEQLPPRFVKCKGEGGRVSPYITGRLSTYWKR